MKRAFLAIAIVLALPATARAGLVTMVARDVPLSPRALQSVAAPMRFNLLGLHWQGHGSVEYRTRSVTGRWEPWRTPDAFRDDGPDEQSPEMKRGWRLGDLDWVGAADGVQFRTAGAVTRLRAFYLWSKVTKPARRTVLVAGLPTIVSRADWQADEKITRAKPRYAPALKLAIVHHTAGTNAYTPEQSAAIVRGIEIYHVQGNGWNDVGYNFLVDRFGAVYEGRGGGIDRNVIGAHSLGFNTGSVGVAMIGNFTTATPPLAMQSALVNLLAWRLDVAHVDPLSRVVYTSRGNQKFRAGKVVPLPAVVGHRDSGPTACPGQAAYALLSELPKRISLTALPKLYSPVLSGVLGGSVRFQARLSSARPWTVTVSGRSGAVIAQGAGSTATVDWTWSSAGAGKGPFGWSIDAGSSVLPASGTLGATRPKPKPAPTSAPEVVVTPLAGLTASPLVVNPNADGTGGYVTVDFTLGAAAAVTVNVTAAVPGAATQLNLFAASLPAGDNSFSWSLASLPDGRYQVVVTVTPKGGSPTMQSAPVTVARTLTSYLLSPALISPNGDGVNDSTTLGFTLAQSVPVQVVIQQSGVAITTVYSGQLGPGPQTVVWDGTATGVRLADGTYEAVVFVIGALGGVAFTLPITVDATPPALMLLDAATLRFQLSEPATVTVTVNGQAVVWPEPAGVFTVPWQGGPVTTISAQAGDAAGNLSPILTVP